METTRGRPATERNPDVEPGEKRYEPEPVPELADDQGPIPTFPALSLDGHGRLISPTPEEREARHVAALRALAELDRRPDDDPPDTEVEMMRGIDAHRPPGRKLFEGVG